MSIEWLQKFCLALPHTTQRVQWDDALVFKVGGKMYAVASLEPGDHWLSLKCSDEEFVELIERPGIVPAPYLARARWIALESEDVLSRAELGGLLTRGHALIFAKLSKKTKAALASPRSGSRPQHRRKHSRRRVAQGKK
jgi:predicted DNA-binding protein (MmcQ/YjbR family)